MAQPKKQDDAASAYLQSLVESGQAKIQQAPAASAATTLANKNAAGAKKPAAPAEEGAIKKTWRTINTPAADLAFGEGATRRTLVGDAGGYRAAAEKEMPSRIQAGEKPSFLDMLTRSASEGTIASPAFGKDAQPGEAELFGLGAGKSAADTAASFTSPVALATGVAGAASKSATALNTLGKTGAFGSLPYLARSVPGIISKVGPTAGRVAKIAAPAFGLQGLYSALFGGSPEETGADKLERQLSGASMVAAGGAGAKAGFEAPTSKPLFGSIGKRIIPESGGMTRGEVYAEARRQGVDMNLAQAGEGKVARSVEVAAEHTPGGAGRLAKAKEAQHEQFARAVDNTKDQFDQFGKGKDVGEQSRLMQEAAKTSKEVAHDNASQKYLDLDTLFKEERVDRTSVKELAKKELKGLYRGNIESVKPTSAVGILKEIVDGPDTTSFGAAHVDRSNLMSARFTDAMIPGKAEAALRRVAQRMNVAMKDSAALAEKKGYKGALTKFNDAQRTWAKYHDTFGDRSSPLARAIEEKEPGKVLDHLLSNTGKGSIRAMRQVTESAPEFKGLLKREFLRRLVDPAGNGESQGFGLMQKRLSQGYSETFLKELFAPEELAQVRKLARIGQSLKFDVNPSGSGKVAMGGAAAYEMASGVKDIGFGAAALDPIMMAKGVAKAAGIPAAAHVAARTLTSPTVTDYLMGYKAPKKPASGVAGVAAGAAKAPAGKTIPNPFGARGGRSAGRFRRFSAK